MTTYTVSSGQTSSGIILNSGDVETVLNGGSATFTTINSGGMLDVDTGGVTSGTAVSSFGREIVYSGGVASGTVVSIFGSEVVYSGGVAVGTVVSSGGAEGIFTGGVASGTVISSGGEEIVSSGGATSGTVISSGGVAYVSSGGVTSGTVVGSTGQEMILTGGVAVGTVVGSGGAEIVGGVASGTVVISGGTQYVEGGVASGTVVSSGGLENVGYGGLSGGVTSGTVVSTGGEEIVSSGAVASGTVVSNGGSLTVSAGGSATSTAIDSGGSLILSAGGSAGITVIGSGGSLTGLFGGIAIAGSGAVLDLLSGAIVSGGITFGGSGGQLQIDGTTMPSAAISGFVSGDTIDLPSIAFDSNGSVDLVSSGGVQNQLQITEGGKTYDLNLDPSQSFAGDLFHIASDGGGGTLVTENQFVVVSGSPGGLTFDIGFDQPDSGTGALPAGFKSAVIAAFQYYANTFNDPGVTLYFNVGYGEVGGSALDKGALGESLTTFQSRTYAALRSAMVADAATAADAAAIANDLPAADPTGGQTLEVAVAEEQALGLISGSPASGAGFAFSNPDGDIGFSSATAFDYTPGQVPPSGTYDFTGTAEHEISEVMGRTSYLTQAGKYSPMDLFRYAGSGSRQLTTGNPSYFSLDGGATDLYNWNNFTTGNNGDLGDWAGSTPYTPDSYNDNSNSGLLNPITSRDTTLMDVLGWNRASATTYTVAAGQTSNGVIIYSGDKELVQSGGMSIVTYALSGGLEMVSAGGSDSGATMSSGAEQEVFGTAGSVVVNGGLQVVELGGTAVNTVLSGSGAVMDLLSGAIVSGGITFSGSGAELQIVGAPPTSPISGFTASGDTIDLTRLAFSGNTSVGFNSATDMLTVTEGGASATIQLDSENYTGIPWAAQSDGVSGTDIAVACYGRGTYILTEAGEVPVEDLAIGDQVMSIWGEAKPIRWIGRRSYQGRFIRGNRLVLPIRIAAGAIAEGIPARDLFVSPEHALFIDGALVPAQLLANGASIAQAESVDDEVEYFHIELDEPDIIFAEGAPTESFVDCDNRGMFQNAGEFAALFPSDRRRTWEFCAPRLEAASAGLTAIRAALFLRAGALGFRLTDDPDLHLIIDGEMVAPNSVVGCVYRFDIPVGSAAVSLASRSTVPAEVDAASRDIRRLGVAVERIVLHDVDLSLEAWHGHAGLCEGFHEDEISHRWTDGMAYLPGNWLASFPDGVTLEVHLIPTGLHYRLPPRVRSTAAA